MNSFWSKLLGSNIPERAINTDTPSVRVEPQPTKLKIGLEERGISEGVSLYLNEGSDIVSECIRRFSEWELTETAFVLKSIKAGDVVVDLGANLGYYTTIMGKLAGPSGRVLAFEPNDLNY